MTGCGAGTSPQFDLAQVPPLRWNSLNRVWYKREGHVVLVCDLIAYYLYAHVYQSLVTRLTFHQITY